MTTLVLGLGNDILGDDGVGIEAARGLRALGGTDIEVIESAEAGLALLEILEGYDTALILDAMCTGVHTPGSIVEFGPESFRTVTAPSPHYAGLPEVLAMADVLELSFPRTIRILAMEVEDPYSIHEGLSPAVRAALPEFITRAAALLASNG
ncbi:MAG: hydrogenase maturation protease [Ignavibacteriae bacterium]|nr:hydrogenase maturation protease [Ignavibacteriota bacterium]